MRGTFFRSLKHSVKAGTCWAGLILGVGCSAPAPPAEPPRLVVVYATCTLGNEFLSPYNPSVPFTPHLKGFAQRAHVFTRHQTEAGQSGPSFASIFSGMQANGHGVFFHPTMLEEDVLTLAEVFADAGYETFFFSGHKMASARLGYGQGVAEDNTFILEQDSVEALTDLRSPFRSVLNRLQTDPTYRAFVQVNFTVTHDPYHQRRDEADVERFCERFPSHCTGISIDEMKPFLELYEKERIGLKWDFPKTTRRLGLEAEDIEKLADILEVHYKTSVEHLDELFGALIDGVHESGLTDDSLIVFTSDHGEVLFRENAFFNWGHGMQLAPEVLNVPLIVRIPQDSSGPGPYEAVSRSIDIFPTVLGLCGIPIPPDWHGEGIDLSAAVLGLRVPPELLAFSHTSVVNPRMLEMARNKGRVLFRTYPEADPTYMWVSVRKRDLVLKMRNPEGRGWQVQAFDLQSDPIQVHNIFDPGDEVHQMMVGRLRRYKTLLVEAYDRGQRERKRPSAMLGDAEQHQLLRAMGYVE